ncbi:MAG: peptide ABC transporter substrate-binding protein [Deltaproteobacteria bacterium]|nr:MAG: peptide ABC transporter substrate-binding protein [Deltaproteobacteria bacterium]
MTIKRLLLIIPSVLVLFLLQSYFWVPTYEDQTKGNPQRLVQFITASIGDASLLNPILSADSASSQIESLVFEGLIDRDENLRFRGRLAKSWEIYEEAYFYVNDEAKIPGSGRIMPGEILSLLQARKSSAHNPANLQASLELIKEINILPPHKFKTIVSIGGREIKATVSAPPRIKLVLQRVDQDLFKNLKLILGKDYFSSFPGWKYVSTDLDIGRAHLKDLARKLLPATEHNPVIVFHLRPGVVFHDGHPFTAKDVKFTYEAIMDPKNLSPRISDYEPVKQVVITDPLTVKVIYKRLYSPALGTWSMGILPEHLLNKQALTKEAIRRGMDPETFSIRQSEFNRHPIGCGPFVFKEWKSDRYIILDRFERYWEGPPNYKQYVFRIIPDLLTQEMEFYAGTVDSYSVQPHQVARLKNDPRFQSFSGLSFGYTYIGYNMRRDLFKDRRVRLALGMAINVDEIIRYVLYGQGERITGPFVKQTDYYNHGIKPVPYDPDGALRLLEEAGWKRNKQGWLEKDGKKFQFTLITNSGNDLRKAILAIAQDAWKRIGIDVRTDVLEWSVFIQERIDKHDFDAVILGWQMGIEPDLYQIWHSSQTHSYQLNFVGFKNKQADDLIIKIRQEYDHDKQVEYCHKLHQIIAREQPYTFLYVNKWTAVLDKRIVIKDVDKNGQVVYRKITPTKTGDYTFYFNKWIKLPRVPNFSPGG